MNKTGLEYLCTTIGNLAGIPVRIFEDGAQTFSYSMVALPRDLWTLCGRQFSPSRTMWATASRPNFIITGS